MSSDRTPRDADALVATARALPKVLLHEHLDGGLRPATLLELGRTLGLRLPADDAPGLEQWFRVRAHSGSLPAFLEGFELTIAAMASLDGLERVAYEAAEDARAEGCVLAEFRCAPDLWETQGIPAEAALDAMLAGLRRSALPCGLIVCALRQHDARATEAAAALAARRLGRGVIGFDLAGPELGHPPAVHARAFTLARGAGVPITIHAGEADAAERVLEAAQLGARRVGHGVRLVDALGTPLFDAVRDFGLHFEVCPTSNVCTGAAASIADHPIRALWRAGIDLGFNTDSRLVTGVGQADEAEVLMREAGFTPAELACMMRNAARASFLPDAQRLAAEAAIDAWCRDQPAGASGSSSVSTP